MSDVTPPLLHGRYEVLAVVGRGGEGTLVRAVDRRHGRDVALKLRRVPGDPRDAERLLVEARTLLSLRPHPGLPLARDDFFEGDRHVLVMDWVDGVDLWAVLTEHGRPGLPPSTVLRWLAPVAQALTHLHTTDPPVVHGDVKPANLVLTPIGQVVLVDFGVSSTRGLRPRGGTPGYRAPEVAAGALPTRLADVYGLAATAFALLVGEPPTGILPSWEDMDRDRAAHLEQALRRGLAIDPTNRTATPGELVEELRAGWDAEPLPTGVLSFLATDVVSSTRLWQELPDTAPGLLAEHLLVVDRAVERHGGRRVGDSVDGDATMSVFHRAGDAVRAGIDLQRDLVGGRVQIHCAAHTGEAVATDGGYVGATLSRVARIRGLADAGQVLVSATTARLAAADLPADVILVALGPHRLAGFDEPEVLLAVEAEGLAVPPDPSVAPYPGLAAFQAADHQLFFGREELADQLVGQIGPGRVVAVVGASGSGKSSLVRAGVLPRLRDATLITPGEHPLAVLPTAAPGPLVVDQLEELVTLCDDTDERAAFADRLVEHRSGCLVTIRADLYGHLADFPRLAVAVAADHVLLGPLDSEQLRRAIVGPAEVRGLALEPGLTDAVLADAQAEPGALPLVAHALSETWLRREGRTLSIVGYRAAGGVRGALAQTAEQLYATLDESDRDILRAVLLRMVEPGEGVADTRRRVGREELAPLGPAGQVDAVLERLAAARLVSLDVDSAEPAHEALLREWPRLRAWIDDAREDLRLHRSVTTAAHEWELGGRDPAELYRGARLARALDWRQVVKPQLIPTEESFLDAGQVLADTERSAAEDRIRHQARQNRRLRTLLVATAVALAVAVLAGGLALVQSRRVADQRDEATRAARESALGALASRVGSVRDTQRDVAALLAVELNSLDPGPAARSALFGTFTDDPGFEGYVQLGDLASGTASVVGEADGRRAMVAGHDGVVHVVDLEHGLDTGERFPDPGFAESSFSRLVLSTDGRLLAQISGIREDVTSGDNWLVLYDVASRTFRVPPIHLEANVGSVAISPDRRWVAVAGGADADAFVHRADTGARVVTIPGLPRTDSFNAFNTAAAAFSPDGHLFVSSDTGGVRVFDPSNGEQLGELPASSAVGGTTADLAFTSDGQTLVGTSEFSMAAWDVPSQTVRWSRSDGGCISMAIAPSQQGPMYCAGGADRVLPIDLTSGQPAGPGFHTQQGQVYGIVFTQHGSRVLFTSQGRPLLGVWRLDGGGPIQRTMAPGAEPRAYRADGEILLVHEMFAERMALWDPVAGTLLDPLDGVEDSLFFVGPDRLAAVWHGQPGVYDYPAGKMIVSAGAGPTGAAADLGGNRMLVWYWDGSHQFFDLTTGGRVGPQLPPNRFTRGATFTADGRYLALSNRIDGVTAFDAITGAKLAGPEAGLASTVINPDGLLIASTRTGDISFRDAATLELRGPSLPAGSGLSNAELGLSADGSLLVASAPGQTQLFDVTSRTPLGGGIETAGSAAVAPDGRQLAVATTSGVALWDLDPSHWVEAACQVAGRNLTRDEWSTYIGDLAPYHETCPTPA